MPRIESKAKPQQETTTFKPCKNESKDACGICLSNDSNSFFCHEYDKASNEHKHHLFCTNCIVDLTEQLRNKPTCPTCRISFKARDILENLEPSFFLKARISHLRSSILIRIQILSAKIYRPIQSYCTMVSSVAILQLLNGTQKPDISIAQALLYTLFAGIIKKFALSFRPDLREAERSKNRASHYIYNPLVIGMISSVATKYLLTPALYLSHPLPSIYSGAIGAFLTWKTAV